MAGRVCPPWIGYFLLNPLRRLFENPRRLLGPWVQEGMTILEPGCGMGYFTLALAEMAGPAGHVIAVDIQQKMLDVLAGRAAKAGVADRIQLRLTQPGRLDLSDLSQNVDLAVAIHMVHELPDPAGFFTDIFRALKTGGRLVFIEPKGHVSAKDFEKSLNLALEIGFTGVETGNRRCVLEKT